jgi:hypothetical protein
MHSLETLRDIRALDLFLASHHREEPYCPIEQGPVVAIATYNFQTREITIMEVPPSRSNSS